MKKLTLQALFVSAIAMFSLNVQADVYNDCVTDGDTIVKLALEKGSTAAQAYEQKSSVKQCYAELDKIEATYGDKTKGLNPSSVMTPADRKKWARLFDSIDAKQFRGTAYLMGAYYR
jgi:hypothetical protein